MNEALTDGKWEMGGKYSHRARELGSHFCTGKRNGVRRGDKLRVEHCYVLVSSNWKARSE